MARLVLLKYTVHLRQNYTSVYSFGYEFRRSRNITAKSVHPCTLLARQRSRCPHIFKKLADTPQQGQKLRHLLSPRVCPIDGFFRLTAGLCRIGINQHCHIAFCHPIVVPFPRQRSFGKVFRNTPYCKRSEHIFFIIQKTDTFVCNGERSLLDNFESIIGIITIA